jgi:glyoxylase-like metal-dependent hydrolase (beta-lactamase superfamily II)
VLGAFEWASGTTVGDVDQGGISSASVSTNVLAPRVSVLTKISKHVYWMPPGPPDRPSVCAVVGDRRALMLDAGSSKAHTRAFLDALRTETAVRPSAVVYTHSDWDHVFGGAEVGGLVIAHALTAEQLIELAGLDWSDEGLDERVAAGHASPQHAANVKEELPSPRTVDVAPADIVFQDGLDVALGGVIVHVRHVGGDHSAESCVMYVEPDRLLFLGDCMYGSPAGALTAEVAFPLYDVILGFDAELYVEGHHSSVLSRPDIEEVNEKMRSAEKSVREGSAITAPDEDTEYFVRAFRAGRATAS